MLLQEARPLLLKAHECLLRATGLLEVISNLRSDSASLQECGGSVSPSVTQQSFVELGKDWHAPLYEIILNLHQYEELNVDKGGFLIMKSCIICTLLHFLFSNTDLSSV